MLTTIIATATAAPVPSDSLLNDPDRSWALQPQAEIGFLAPLAHGIQFGKDGSRLDYIEEGGQDNLFLATRWSLDLAFDGGQTVTLLYQPLDLVTEREAERNLVFDGIEFGRGTPMVYRYGFDFYRGSITWDLLKKDPKNEWSLGASLQIRNASISMGSKDGEAITTNRDIGPVPIIKTRGRFERQGWWWGFEADGFYAPVKYINGSDVDVVGSILDASIRVGASGKQGIDPFLNLRYLGGGAEGTSKNPDPGKDGWVENWLHFATLTAGVSVR